MAREVRAAVLVLFTKEKEDGRCQENRHCLPGNESSETSKLSRFAMRSNETACGDNILNKYIDLNRITMLCAIKYIVICM